MLQFSRNFLYILYTITPLPTDVCNVQYQKIMELFVQFGVWYVHMSLHCNVGVSVSQPLAWSSPLSEQLTPGLGSVQAAPALQSCAEWQWEWWLCYTPLHWTSGRPVSPSLSSPWTGPTGPCWRWQVRPVRCVTQCYCVCCGNVRCVTQCYCVCCRNVRPGRTSWAVNWDQIYCFIWSVLISMTKQ